MTTSPMISTRQRRTSQSVRGIRPASASRSGPAPSVMRGACSPGARVPVQTCRASPRGRYNGRAVTEPETSTQLPVPLGRPSPGIVGASVAMLGVYEKVARYGPTDAAVLVTGETGTGKELVARALHLRSLRRAKPFVALNCSALNEELFESELFGHERGAFTGAVGVHRGRFERADGGTLFLDEVGDMPLRVQAKLLRVLEDGVFERVGGEKEIAGDVRIVAATNAPLERAVAARRFREDLYHRVAVLRIHVPPLRERADDVPLLAEHFLRIFAERYGRGPRRLSPEAVRLLEIGRAHV